MGFQGIKATAKKGAAIVAPTRPQRAPRPEAREREPAAAPPPPESHEFPDFYDYGSAGANPPPSNPPARQLDAGLDRLVELAGAHLGCPHEELLALKALALDDADQVASFCSHIFETRARPDRERVDPLAKPRAEGQCAFWIEALSGKAVAVAEMSEELRPYDGQRLELYDPALTPFAHLFAAEIPHESDIGPKGDPSGALDMQPPKLIDFQSFIK